MAVLPVRFIGDPVLRQPAHSVSPEVLASPEFQSFIDDLVETMHHANGAGLAAPQVGRSVAVAAVHVEANPRYPYKPDVPLTVFVNPTLTVLGTDTARIFEGCLSVPDLRGQVQRAMHVRVDAVDRAGVPFTFEARGLTAGTLQHELDHLDGLLFVDRVEDPKTLCTWDNFERFHRAAFLEEVEAIHRRHGTGPGSSVGS